MSDLEYITVVEDEAPPGPPSRTGPPWKVAVIDDDAAVHDGTRFALQDYALNGRGLELISARSAAEGRRLIADHPDTAVIFLDVVMESDTAGLDLVDVIRRELGNDTVRIILRTGQPGQAPEQRIVVDYDINDYKAKTELTAEKLFTSLTAALRGFEQLKHLTETRRGLEIIIDGGAGLPDLRARDRLGEAMLTQLAALLGVPAAGILAARGPAGGLFAAAATGPYAGLSGRPLDPDMEGEATALAEAAMAAGAHVGGDRHLALHAGMAGGRELVVMHRIDRPLTATERPLVEIFVGRLAAAFENAALYEEVESANRLLEERVENRTRELSLANQRLEARWQRLQSANAFKNEMLGTVAHDLKNPLGVILGRAEMLAEILNMSPVPLTAGAAQVGHIRDTALRMTTLVDSLIADAMADALDVTLRREPVDLARLVREVVEANRMSFHRKNQRLALDAPAALGLSADPDRLREALDNLVSNAVKYTPIGGAIAVSAAVEGEEAVVRVVDSGPGFSPEDISRLFGRFQRLSAKPTGGENSTGLGLSIAKRVIELHAGRIIAENAGSAGGAAFTVSLPLQADPTEP